MFKLASPLFLIAETPLHAGSGNDLGIVDLPIQREKHTGFPKIEASGLKGSLREIFEAQEGQLPPGLEGKYPQLTENGQYKKSGIFKAFGPEKDGSEHAGALGFTDARLLLFPVKSVKNIFAWITCPTVLKRFQNDLALTKKADVSALDDAEEFVNSVPPNSGLTMKDGDKTKVVLEEYAFEVSENEKCAEFFNWLADNILPETSDYDFWREKMKADVIVLDDDVFRDFVTLSTEVIARIKIDDDKGTVEKGGLWYEEYLPSDSVLYSLALATPVFGIKKNDNPILKTAEDVMSFFELGLPEIFQIGGNATLGKGLIRVKMMKNSDADGQGGQNA